MMTDTCSPPATIATPTQWLVATIICAMRRQISPVYFPGRDDAFYSRIRWCPSRLGKEVNHPEFPSVSALPSADLELRARNLFCPASTTPLVPRSHDATCDPVRGNYSMHYTPSRRGTVLILVLGLITLFMALMLSATVRVYNAGKTITTLQKNVQAYVMMQAAKMYYAQGCSFSLGDKFDTTSFTGHPQAHRLGWAHISPTTMIDVVATGGASAGWFPARLTNISAPCPTRTDIENQLASAMEIRYYYQITGLLTGPFDVKLMPVGDNANYIYP